MNKKSFFLGIVTGIILILAILLIVYAVTKASDDESIQYLEKPVSYENKIETSFKIFQVLEDAALANEVSYKGSNIYRGNIVVILGENYYTNQVITIKNPLMLGTYSYISIDDTPLTVPIIDGDIIIE